MPKKKAFPTKKKSKKTVSIQKTKAKHIKKAEFQNMSFKQT